MQRLWEQISKDGGESGETKPEMTKTDQGYDTTEIEMEKTDPQMNVGGQEKVDCFASSTFS